MVVTVHYRNTKTRWAEVPNIHSKSSFVRFEKAYEKALVPNFLDENDSRFAGLRGTRDCIARKLRQDGVGVSVKHADVISRAEEARL